MKHYVLTTTPIPCTAQGVERGQGKREAEEGRWDEGGFSSLLVSNCSKCQILFEMPWVIEEIHR